MGQAVDSLQVQVAESALPTSNASDPGVQRYHLRRSRLDPVQRISRPLQRHGRRGPVGAKLAIAYSVGAFQG